MNKQFILSIVVVFIVAMALGFGVHGALLHADYAQLPNLMRPEAEAGSYMWAMLLAHVLIAVGFTAIYRQGRDANKPWLGQGVRFGLLWAIGVALPMYLIYHAVAQFPLALALKQCLYDGLSVVVLGLVVAAMNKTPAQAAA